MSVEEVNAELQSIRERLGRFRMLLGFCPHRRLEGRLPAPHGYSWQRAVSTSADYVGPTALPTTGFRTAFISSSDSSDSDPISNESFTRHRPPYDSPSSSSETSPRPWQHRSTRISPDLSDRDSRFASPAASPEAEVARRKSYSGEPVYAHVDDFEAQHSSTEKLLPRSAMGQQKNGSGKENTEAAVNTDLSPDNLQSREFTPRRKSGSDTAASYKEQIPSDDEQLASGEGVDGANDEWDSAELDELLSQRGSAGDGSDFAYE